MIFPVPREPTHLREGSSYNQSDENQLTRTGIYSERPKMLTNKLRNCFHCGWDGNPEESNHAGNDNSDNDACLWLPEVVESGVVYQPTRILVEGWLHKKGTGNDWLSSRLWKTRWSRIIMARVDGQKVEVPLLLIYWNDITPKPSTVIPLESTVVLPVDKLEGNNLDLCCFEILSARNAMQNNLSPIARTFAAPRKERDDWAYAISTALLQYEKENAKVRKAEATAALMKSKLHNKNATGRENLLDRISTNTDQGGFDCGLEISYRSCNALRPQSFIPLSPS